MEVVEAIKARKSVRAFLPIPVPHKTLKEIMEVSLRAPSWADTQPWEFALIGGPVMTALKAALAAKIAAGASSVTEVPRPNFPEKYLARRQANGQRLMEALGIARDDRERRQQWSAQMGRFFDAPNGLIVFMDKELGAYSFLDLGLILQTIMLTAVHYGVGTCPLAAAVAYPDVLRQFLHIPTTKQIVLGLAIGYPDPQAPANSFHSLREPMESLITWHGF